MLFSLAYRSLKNRKLTSILTLLSLALSVCLWVGIEHIRAGARESFSNTISQTDLIVGARGGAISLLLYTVFHIGTPTANVSYESYEKIKNQPAVSWTIPISLGDSHRGYRVVGTNEDFYRHYRYRQDRQIELQQGRMPTEVFDVALGSEVSEKLGYRLGDRIVITHGITRGVGIMEHADKPFTVVGILRPTRTPIDQAVYITLEGMEAIHIDWQQGAPPLKGQEIPAEQIKKEEIKIGQITAFFLRTKSRIQTLALQRQINTFPEEPLMALYTSLNERRREIAILRAIGVGPAGIIFLLVLESGLLTLVGTVLGIGLLYGLVVLLQPVVEQQFGLHIPIEALTSTEYTYIAGVFFAGVIIGFVPAWKAYRNALTDGLCVRI